mmetsp:Transcript_10835/g.20640  ORF Transcript_10835/g.20640 Transcript_10835/m.20640 type:complete len:381 (-) Transcript_10835:78-1220(-)
MLAEHGHELGDFILLLLEDALSDPHQVSDLLLLELDIGVEAGVVHLPLEGKLKHLNITLIEGIIDGLVRGRSMDVPESGVLGEKLKNATELILIGHICEHGSPSRVKVPNSGIKTLPVSRSHGWLVEGGAERVERDVDGVGVSADAQQLAHEDGGLSAKLIDVRSEVLNPVLDQRRLDNLDLHLFHDISDVAATAVRGLLEELGEVRADRGVDEDSLVEVCVSRWCRLEGRDGPHGGLLEHTERVALGDELVDVPAGEGALEQEHDVLDHVLERDEVEELAKRLDRLSAQVFELLHELLHSGALEGRGGQRRHVREGVVVVRLGQVEADIIEGLALGQVVVVRVRQKAAPQPPYQRLRKGVEDVEGVHATGLLDFRHGCD